MFALPGHPVNDTLPPTDKAASARCRRGNTRCAYLLRIAQKRKKNRHGIKKFSRGSTT
jgi:hypothetical protein